jgi:hypothetical protein
MFGHYISFPSDLLMRTETETYNYAPLSTYSCVRGEVLTLLILWVAKFLRQGSWDLDDTAEPQRHRNRSTGPYDRHCRRKDSVNPTSFSPS